LKVVKQNNLSTIQEVKRECIALHLIKYNTRPLTHSQELLFDYHDMAKEAHMFCTKYFIGPTLTKFLENLVSYYDPWSGRILIMTEVAIALFCDFEYLFI
jgi:hypothetical protein